MFCTFQCKIIYTFQILALGGISELHKTKYPIGSEGLCPPGPLLQRSTTVISPPLRKS